MRKIFIIISFTIILVNQKCDAQNWTPLGKGIHGFVTCMSFYNNELYVGGQFDSAGDVAAKNIAKWNGISWSPVGEGAIGVVSKMVVYKGELYMAGAFDISKERAEIAKWDGEKITNVGKGIRTSFFISSLTEYKGILYVAGSFDSAGGMPANNIAEWDGKKWDTITGLNGEITSLEIYRDELYAMGHFDNGHVAVLIGRDWYLIGAEPNGEIYGHVVFDHKLFLSGNFDTVYRKKCPALYASDSITWYPANEGIDTTFLFDVSILTVHDGHLLAGLCPVSVYDSLPTKSMYEWDGKKWSPFKNEIDGVIGDMLSYNGALYVGGGFSFYFNGKSINGITKWEPTIHRQ